MGTVSTLFSFTSDSETVTRTKLNTLVADLATEFNGNITNANIDDSAGIVASKIDFTTASAIGSTVASTGAFTTLTASGSVTLNGDTTIGNATGDALTFHPSAWTLSNAVTITGTWTDLGTVTTVDINGGTADAVTLGGSAACVVTGLTMTLGSDADGDIYYRSSNALTRLEKGTSGQALLMNSGETAPEWGSVSSVEVFTSSGTFTAPAGVTKVYVSMIAGGGGGGGANGGGQGAGGGGAGAYTIMQPYTVTPAGEYTVTVGATGGTAGAESNGGDGADTVFDNLTCAGGSGGEGVASSTGGVGGVAPGNDGSGVTGGDSLNGMFSGGTGADGTGGGNGGGGGGSPFGSGGGGGTGSNDGTAAAANTGAGGGGGGDNSGATKIGAAGGTGICIVRW